MINPFGLLTRRVRGFRVIDIAAVGVIVVTALATYAFKTSAGAEDADSLGIEGQIVAEQQQIRLLHAELAKLDDPTRIEALSSQYLGMGAETAKQDISEVDLGRIASRPAAPAPVLTPSPAPDDPEATPTSVETPPSSASSPRPAAPPVHARAG